LQRFEPPYCGVDQAVSRLREDGFALLHANDLAAWCQVASSEWQALGQAWQGLPPDEYLKDGGRYRRRRHSCYVVTHDQVQAVPHRAHWQPVAYNALHGGMQRWFEPVLPQTAALPAWQGLLRGIARAADALRGPQPWYVEAHQFRIDTTDGIGRPTPEGAHRDGVDLVWVMLVQRHGIRGAESRVFQADGPAGQRFTLDEPMSVLWLDDARVVHETTPIMPEDDFGWRDTLVLTCRAGGFQVAGTDPQAISD
jgi:hypothetical protein